MNTTLTYTIEDAVANKAGLSDAEILSSLRAANPQNLGPHVTDKAILKALEKERKKLAEATAQEIHEVPEVSEESSSENTDEITFDDLFDVWSDEDYSGATPAEIAKRISDLEIDLHQSGEVEDVESEERLRRELERAKGWAKAAPAKTQKAKTPAKQVDYPPEFAPAVPGAYKKDGRWFIQRCYLCGNFGKKKCCGENTYNVLGVRDDGTLTTYGRQAAGLEPIKPPTKSTPEQDLKSLKEQAWWSAFSGFDELEDGGLKMFVESFIPEGVTIISSLPKEGKTWLALSIAKALTTGQPLFGRPGYEVAEPTPVLYMAAEVGDRAFKHRVRMFGITNDKTKFLCHTLSKGSMSLRDQNLLDAVRALKPVVILDVLSCFSQSEDEDDSVQNQKLRTMIADLRRTGSPAIIVLHHSTKNFKDKPTKEHAVRGSGDILAMVDAVWALMKDDRLEQRTGVTEVEVVGWGRDFCPSPLRLALTRKAEEGELQIKPGIASLVGQTGDLVWVDKQAVREAAEKADQDLGDALETLLKNDPTLTLEKLAEDVQSTVWNVAGILKERGWTKDAGRSKKGKPNMWRKAG